MTPLDALRSALDNIRGHTLRSGLTMLGMVFGVAAVIAMLSIGGGAEREAMEMIERLGARNIILRDVEMRDEELLEIRETSTGLSLRDVKAIGAAIPGVIRVEPRVAHEPSSVFAGTRTTDATLLGVTPEHAELTALELVEGRFLDPIDTRDHAQVCVIGEAVRRDLFGFEPVLGSALKVDHLWLQVVGVAAGTGGSSFEGVSLGSTDREILVPVTTALTKLDLPPLEAPLDEIVVELGPGADAGRTAVLVDALMDRLHAGADDYQLVVPELLLEQSRRTQRLFNLVMGCIAGISLLVGGIGIMNIMLASVLERTREIGVRRAVGARRRDIRNLFLIESFTISLLGGAFGVGLGVAIAAIIATSAGWPTVVTVWSILLSTGVAMTVGLVSGLYPALRAAAMSPIEALRHE